jgi:alpha/beta superfamily hydrolase
MHQALPVYEEIVGFPCGEEILEGVLAYPSDEAPAQGILLLSPHPHMGGRMDNNLIAHLAQRFAAEGNATLRFNYGGVGRSSRAGMDTAACYAFWAQVESEKNYRALLPDVRAARTFLSRQVPGLPLTYLGYSFGACMAALLAHEEAPAQLGLISPPVARAPLEHLESLTAPVCVVVGDNDFVFDPDIFASLYALIPAAKAHVTLAGCDHFFRKQEERVYDAIQGFFRDLPEPEVSS